MNYTATQVSNSRNIIQHSSGSFFFPEDNYFKFNISSRSNLHILIEGIQSTSVSKLNFLYSYNMLNMYTVFYYELSTTPFIITPTDLIYNKTKIYHIGCCFC